MCKLLCLVSSVCFRSSVNNNKLLRISLAMSDRCEAVEPAGDGGLLVFVATTAARQAGRAVSGPGLGS